MKKEDLKIGLKVRDYQLKTMGTAATITELTQHGFKYTIDNPYWVKLGTNDFSEVRGGEVYLSGLLEWEIVKNRVIYHQETIYTGINPC